jgi:CHAT domain-containing protein
MNETLKNVENVREYLLGRIADDKILEEIEELLFLDEDFCTLAEITEDELINDFVFERLSETDAKSFAATLERNPERREKIALTRSLKTKTQAQIVTEAEKKPRFFVALRAFFQKPLYAGAFAFLLIATAALAVFVLTRREANELAELRGIYQKQRPVETRISQFDYAPLPVLRGETENAEKNRLRGIEIRLIEAVVNNPSAETHHALGVFDLTQQKLPEAVKELTQAVRLDDRNARFHNDLGAAYFETAKAGAKDQRLESLARANEEFASASELDANLLEALFNRALTLQELNDLPGQAKQAWEKYLEKDPNSKWSEEARKNLEKLNQMQSRFKTKDEILRDFLTAFRNKNDGAAQKIHNDTKGMLNTLSLPVQLTRRYLEARRAQNKPDAADTIDALNYIGRFEKEKHADFFVSEIADFYARADAAKIEKLLQAHALFDNARKSENVTEAIRLYEKSRDAFQALGDESEALNAELRAAQYLPDISKFAESRARLKDLIQITERKNFSALNITAVYWLAVSDYRQNRFSSAIANAKKALAVAERTENFFEFEHCSHLLAENYLFLGDLENSLFYLNRILFANRDYFQDKNQFWRNSGTFAELTQKMRLFSTSFSFAREMYETALAISAENERVDTSLKYISNALAGKKDLDDALRYAVESNKIAAARGERAENVPMIANSFLLIADLKVSMNDCVEALADYERALEFFQKIPEYTVSLYETHKGKLLCYQNLNRYDEFESELGAVLSLSEDYRAEIRNDNARQNFFEAEQVVFDAAIENALRVGDRTKAFEYAELSKARSLLDFVKSHKTIAELENEFSAVSKPLSLAEIQARMPENVQLVQYAALSGKLAIWVLAKNRFELLEKSIAADDLEKKIDDYRQLILDKNDGASLRQAARELYEILIPANLDREKTVCLIPDKSLNQIPFAALISEREKYFLEDYAIMYSPSASVFILTSENANCKKPGAAENLLSVGNPAFDRAENPSLANLPEAEIEAKKIAELYPQAKQLIGENASKEAFLNDLTDAAIVHFAGHFIAQKASPSNSRLLFAGDDLRSFELAEKKLSNSKLVVLSACETGFERYNRSEGAVGIARTFLAMGAPLVVASGWKVDSEAAKDLMIAFHQSRRVHHLSSVEALRRAQLEMLQTPNLSAPFYWSAFSLVGGYAEY